MESHLPYGQAHYWLSLAQRQASTITANRIRRFSYLPARLLCGGEIWVSIVQQCEQATFFTYRHGSRIRS